MILGRKYINFMLSRTDLGQIREIVKEEVKTAVDVVDKKLDKAQEDISEILTEVIKHHDDLEKRVERIENHLDLPEPQ